MLFYPATGFASVLPTGGTVIHGDVEIGSEGALMNINQATHSAIVDWQSFNIGTDASVIVNQPNSSAAMLSRVVGGDPSAILGSLEANGIFYLVNPRGIIFGQDAMVDVGALVASTLDITDSDFLAGRNIFSGDSDYGITNYGVIKASDFVVLLAQHIKNYGTIQSPGGTAALAARDGSLQIDKAYGGTISIDVSGIAAGAGQIANTGYIDIAGTDNAVPDGGSAILEGDRIVHSGEIRADGASSGGHGGLISLLAGDSLSIEAGSSLSAQGEGGAVAASSSGGLSVASGATLIADGDISLEAGGALEISDGSDIVAGGNLLLIGVADEGDGSESGEDAVGDEGGESEAADAAEETGDGEAVATDGKSTDASTEETTEEDAIADSSEDTADTSDTSAESDADDAEAITDATEVADASDESSDSPGDSSENPSNTSDESDAETTDAEVIAEAGDDSSTAAEESTDATEVADSSADSSGAADESDDAFPDAGAAGDKPGKGSGSQTVTIGTLPSNPVIVSGLVDVNSSAATMTIEQATEAAVVEWETFSIGLENAVFVEQPSAVSALLSRIVGTDPSEILGTLEVTGYLYLINPRGIIFGEDAVVDAAGLVASTLDMTDNDFLDGKIVFSGNSANAITHRGALRTEDLVRLIAGEIETSGIIEVAGGSIRIESQSTIDLGDGTLIAANAVGGGPAGSISVIGEGDITVTADATLEATGGGGLIEVDSGDSGTTMIYGKIDASGTGSGQSGGEVRALGMNVGLAGSGFLSTRPGIPMVGPFSSAEMRVAKAR